MSSKSTVSLAPNNNLKHATKAQTVLANELDATIFHLHF